MFLAFSGFVDATCIAMRRIHIRSKSELIAVIVMIAIYFILNIAIQTIKPDMNQKKINTVSLVVAVIVGLIIIFAQ